MIDDAAGACSKVACSGSKPFVTSGRAACRPLAAVHAPPATRRSAADRRCAGPPADHLLAAPAALQGYSAPSTSTGAAPGAGTCPTRARLALPYAPSPAQAVMPPATVALYIGQVGVWAAASKARTRGPGPAQKREKQARSKLEQQQKRERIMRQRRTRSSSVRSLAHVLTEPRRLVWRRP